MKDVHSIIAENLSSLRKASGLTQAQIAERLSYSDKAVSRWERGDTLPDINVLCELCDFYGITLDSLVQKGSAGEKGQVSVKDSLSYRIALNALAVAIVWLIATVGFVYAKAVKDFNSWVLFVWAIPASCVAMMLMNKHHHLPLLNFLLYSVLNWTLLTSIYLQYLHYNLWLIFIVGLPVQVILILWYLVRKSK